jgi:hypothetical protein
MTMSREVVFVALLVAFAVVSSALLSERRPLSPYWPSSAAAAVPKIAGNGSSIVLTTGEPR